MCILLMAYLWAWFFGCTFMSFCVHLCFRVLLDLLLECAWGFLHDLVLGVPPILGMHPGFRTLHAFC